MMRYDGSVGHCRAKGVEAPHTGTTIVACCYKDGVVLGSDGRVSVGNYISNRASNKIAPLADHVFLLRSGSAPDAQQVSDHGECLSWTEDRIAPPTVLFSLRSVPA